MRQAGRILADGVIAVVLCAVVFLLGVGVGRDAGRIDALRAEAAAPVVRIGPQAAAARVDPICRTKNSRQQAAGSRRRAYGR
jgi:hypothetical protein